MEQDTARKGTSWLSLVAEIAGVSGATVARVELCTPFAPAQLTKPVRAIVQIQSCSDEISGAAQTWGTVAELVEGLRVDVGCDLSETLGATIVAWIEIEPNCPNQFVEAQNAVAPRNATRTALDPTRAMKLMLAAPTPVPARASRERGASLDAA
jgi:hypothetical protein